MDLAISLRKFHEIQKNRRGGGTRPLRPLDPPIVSDELRQLFRIADSDSCTSQSTSQCYHIILSHS